MGSEVESLSLVSLLRHSTAQRDCHSHNTAGPRHLRNMDLDRVQDRGSLLNKVYETQCLMDMKMEERKPEQVLSVVGGRMVLQAAPSPYPLTGQQLMMQLDNLTSGITSMSVQEEAMEEEDSPTEQVGQGVQGPFCQEEKRPSLYSKPCSPQPPSPQPLPASSSRTSPESAKSGPLPHTTTDRQSLRDTE